MEIFALEDFKIEFEKFKSKKSYRSITEEIIAYFFGKTAAELSSA